MNKIYESYRIGIKKIFLIAGLVVLFLQNQGFAQKIIEVVYPPRILEFFGDQPMTRVGRPFVVLASISNPAKNPVNFVTILRTPDGIRIEGTAERPITLAPNEKVTLRWTLFGDKPLYGELLLEVTNKLDVLAAGRLTGAFFATNGKNRSCLPARAQAC